MRGEAPNGGRSVGPGERRAAQGDFQILRTGDGDQGKSLTKHQNFVHFFFKQVAELHRVFLYPGWLILAVVYPIYPTAVTRLIFSRVSDSRLSFR